ncbi:D-hexose-6-phosphate mutarotase [Pseudoxanthomonas sacheonensis]|uniref:Putative glucose-6-phosphate 1-epimerase n=1 Tax=Pseudoxanthomonas sacheonensis TaxID=443615 RepID=A0ABU1RSI9_9GAMM|nr:D-hexose-6-phosphate mutarotase [Pseudoxanthomonas sacheonensis]MDR6841742.1 glucose-6-phosphate 1-epimerase [Pseudoxanthomonas sacheonensis]
MTIAVGEFQGFPVLRIETPLASAAISLHGGQLLSYAPRGFDDLLWLSPVSKRAPDAIRGGVPVCWPYFGREGQSPEAPQHGFARNTQWILIDSRIDAEGEATIELALPQKTGVPLRLTQTLRIGSELRQSLSTHNDGGATISLTQALHTYFRVGDAERAHVTELEGLVYADRYDGQRHTQSGEWNLQDPRDPGRSDRTYQRSGNRFALVDPALNRRIDLTTSGSRSLVVWNPGQTGIAAIGDAPGDGWRHFVCLEAANAGEDVIELKPNESHTLQQIVSVSAL